MQHVGDPDLVSEAIRRSRGSVESRHGRREGGGEAAAGDAEREELRGAKCAAKLPSAGGCAVARQIPSTRTALADAEGVNSGKGNRAVMGR